jgi:hypothetical protein
VPGQSATKLFVALDAGGTLTKNSGATLAARTGTGAYRIALNTDITNCVYLGTAGQDAGSGSDDYNLYTSRTNTHTANVAIFDGGTTPSTCLSISRSSAERAKRDAWTRDSARVIRTRTPQPSTAESRRRSALNSSLPMLAIAAMLPAPVKTTTDPAWHAWCPQQKRPRFLGLSQ